jgi:hypothetical protein
MSKSKNAKKETKQKEPNKMDKQLEALCDKHDVQATMEELNPVNPKFFPPLPTIAQAKTLQLKEKKEKEKKESENEQQPEQEQKKDKEMQVEEQEEEMKDKEMKDKEEKDKQNQEE